MRRLHEAAQAGALPAISAIVATYNRAPLLARTLQSLVAQTLSRDAFEVLVIDDGSNDQTREVVERYTSALPLRYALQRNAGLAAAKNHGLFLSSAPVVLFLDDDDLAAPDMLAEHLATHRAYPAVSDAVLGYTDLDSSLANDPLMRFVTEVGCFLFSYPAIRDGQCLDFTYFWGGRSSCKRALLIECGIFDPRFRFGCEDIELGFRLSRQGLRVVYNARARSTTIRGITVDGFCDRLVRQGRSNALFSRLHGDEAVRRWTEVDGAEQAWQRVAPAYDALIGAARHLDAQARRKQAAGRALERAEEHWLHHAYRTAFRAAKLRGIIEGLEATAS